MSPIKHVGGCILSALLIWGMAQASLADEAPAAAAAAPAGQVFALVNGKPVSIQEFNARYSAIIRQRYYHGAPPERQADAVRQEVADLLIERTLLIEEAGKRGIQPDAARIEQAVAAAEKRYAAAPEWQQQREALLPQLKDQVARQSLFEQIEKAIREVPPPTPAEIRAFYDQKPELFTEPEKLRMSVIRLNVDPGAPRADWNKARAEAQAIYQRLKDGADFAELARLHSGDPSASNGGDLGYLHGGMLSEELQGKIDKFQIGEIAEPITVLEGISVYRVDDRIPAKLREFAEVESRAQDLLRREQAERAWKETTARLRAEARIDILVPLGGGADKQGEAAKQETVKQEAAKQETVKKKVNKKKAEKKKKAL